MKKIFTKKTLIITGITYVLIGLAFLIGYSTHSGSGFIDFGSSFSGMALSVIAFPFAVIGSIIYIVVKLKPNVKFAIIGL